MIFNQNISFGKFTNAIISVMALAWTFVSCVQIEENRQGTGYITFSPITVDYSVENLVPTKAAVPAEDLPSAEDFTVTISGGSLQEPIVYAPGKLPAGQIQLEVGEYDVEASYGSNIFNNPYFYASTTVEIGLGEVKEVSLNDVPLENSMVAVLLPDDFSDHMTVSSILLSDDSGSLEVQAGKYYYAPSGREVSVTFAGTNSAGQKKTISLSLGVLKPQHAYDVKCNMDLPTLSFTNQAGGAWASRLYLTSLATSDQTIDNDLVIYKISTDGTNWDNVDPVQKDGYWVIEGLVNNTKYYIKAVYGALETDPWEFTPVLTSNLSLDLSHTYSSGYLNGTSAVVSGDVSYPSIVASLIASKGSLGAELYSSSDVLVRTITSKTGTMSDTNGWPYLPQGDYTLKPYYQIGSDKVYLPSVEDTAGSPSFTVTAYAETSYSRYLSGLASANDAGTGDKVMNIRADISISNDILANTNYSSIIGEATLKYDNLSMLTSTSVSSNVIVPNTLENNTNLLDGDDLISQSWDSHTVTASFSFDGASDDDALTCHVTGIPHRVDNMGNCSDYGWTKSGATSVIGAISISNKGSYIQSPQFFVPVDKQIKVKTDFTASYYLWGKGTLYISVTNTPSREGYSIAIDDHSTLGDSSNLKQRSIGGLVLTGSTSKVSYYLYKSSGTPTVWVGKCYILYEL